ncbi:thioredoxin family protein [Neobacillus dielmonensis]|uniref:thioredoxin family protein n=1 Tax=Neobacillus dielmonensis TaxID=1347369 RepID=UPI0005A6BE34|nr:thioredoxin family protein [Neobacillus dielmonensis]
MNLNEWFEKGMSAEAYINSMTKNKEGMLSIYNQFSISEQDQSRLEQVKQQNLRAIVLSEDWCGDAMLNNPILLRIAEGAGMEVRFLLRDQNLELMDQYLTNGTSRAIPIFIFIDQDGNERGKWGPRAPEMQELVDKGRAALPDKEDPDFQKQQLQLYRSLGQAYQTDPAIWQTVAASILSKLL